MVDKLLENQEIHGKFGLSGFFGSKAMNIKSEICGIHDGEFGGNIYK